MYRNIMNNWIVGLIALSLWALPVYPGPAAGETAIEPPLLHHILIEVTDLKASIRFYHDYLGLKIGSVSGDFAQLESAGAGIYLWQKRWNFEKAGTDAPRGLGIYPHFEVQDVAGAVDRFRKGGYGIVQEPKTYGWGTEAFVRDPDGYVIALVNMTEKSN